MRQRNIRADSKDLKSFSRMLLKGNINLEVTHDNGTIKILRLSAEDDTYELRFNYSDSIYRLLPDLEPTSYWVVGTLYDEPIEKKFDSREAAEAWLEKLGSDNTLEIQERGGEDDGL
jgi:hypothetical protein